MKNPACTGSPPAAAARLSALGVANALAQLPKAFRDAPQFTALALSRRLGCTIALKDESKNPVGSFKGRGVAQFLASLSTERHSGLVCASAGNFGLALAYLGRQRNLAVTVFVAETASAYKVQLIRGCGAEIKVAGRDFDAAKQAACHYARDQGLRFVEDGAEVAIAEGAGTIAIEMLADPLPFDSILVPLGNGALLAGMACWIRAQAPNTEVIGVVAAGAPIMAACLRLNTASPPGIENPVATIADGIAVRVPVAEAVEDLRGRVDDVIQVSDEVLLAAMSMLREDCGLTVEPAAAAGVAAIATHRHRFAGRRVATVITGANIAPV